MEKDNFKYRGDLESIVAKLGKVWKNLPLQEVIRFCTNFKVISSTQEGEFTVLKLKNNKKLRYKYH